MRTETGDVAQSLQIAVTAVVTVHTGRSTLYETYTGQNIGRMGRTGRWLQPIVP
jgi:hypothetical protein